MELMGVELKYNGLASLWDMCQEPSVIVIPKAGRRPEDEPTSYRPISLPSALAAFIDIEGAFDNTSYRSIKNVLEERRVEAPIKGWTEAMLKQTAQLLP